MTAAAPAKNAPPPPDDQPPPAMTMESAAAERTERLRRRQEEAEAAAKPTLAIFRALLDARAGLNEQGQGQPLGFSENGAALFVAHMLVDLGSAKVHKMTGREAVAHAVLWRKMNPMMWPQMMMGDVLRFVHRIAMHGTEHDTIDGYNAAIAKINPTPIPLGF
jgi:hypothetical protein